MSTHTNTQKPDREGDRDRERERERMEQIERYKQRWKAADRERHNKCSQ